MKPRVAAVAAIVIAAWALPYGLDSYTIHVVNIALIYALLAIGMGLAMGISGQINLAQVAFFGVGAYGIAILTTHSGYGFWAAAVLALLAAVAVGLFVGLPALRMQSHYLGIVTLGLALGFINWITNATITGGADGISGIPVPTLPGIDLSSEYLYYYLEAIVFAVGLFFGLFVVHTALGRRLRAMRDDSLAAGAMGAEIPLLRMTAFLLASLYGGLAGILYGGLIRYVAPETFSISNMFILLAMVIIGGRRSLVGCVVGAIGLTLVREWLSDFSTYAQLGYGVVVVLMVVFAPTGLAGVPARLRDLYRRRRGHRTTRAELRSFTPYEPVEYTSHQQPVLLQIDAVTKQFRGLRALDEVSLSVGAGEIRGIVGPNGSGKTTLFNVISGFYRATSGSVCFADTETTTARPYALSLAGMARTFQNLRLFGQLTVRENILVALDRSRTRAIWRYAVWQPGVVAQERRLRARRTRPSTATVWVTSPRRHPPRCPTASNAALKSPAPWPASRACSFSTNRRRGSTARRSSNSSESSARSATAAPRSFSSSTTWAWSCRCAKRSRSCPAARSSRKVRHRKSSRPPKSSRPTSGTPN